MDDVFELPRLLKNAKSRRNNANTDERHAKADADVRDLTVKIEAARQQFAAGAAESDSDTDPDEGVAEGEDVEEEVPDVPEVKARKKKKPLVKAKKEEEMSHEAEEESAPEARGSKARKEESTTEVEKTKARIAELKVEAEELRLAREENDLLRAKLESLRTHGHGGTPAVKRMRLDARALGVPRLLEPRMMQVGGVLSKWMERPASRPWEEWIEDIGEAPYRDDSPWRVAHNALCRVEYQRRVGELEAPA